MWASTETRPRCGTEPEIGTGTASRRRHRFRRSTFAWALGLALLAPAPGPVWAEDRDPALAPPLEELEAEAARWRQRRQTGALVLLGSLVVASGIIGWARHRARGARRGQAPVAPVDNPTSRRPR